MKYFFFNGSQSFDDIVRDPGPKTTYEVAIFASDRWRKVSFAANVLEGTKDFLSFRSFFLLIIMCIMSRWKAEMKWTPTAKSP